MNKICCIIDLEGFTVRLSEDDGLTSKPEFFIRELGYIQVDGESLCPAKSYRFDLRGHLDVDKCSLREWNTIEHQCRKIIGLPVFSSLRERAMDYDERFEIIRYIYDQCRKSNLDIIAYKGGCVEKHFLQQADIPFDNLELYGCPKYQTLVKTDDQNYKQPSNCGHHVLSRKSMLTHCAEAEVSAYRDWLISKMRKLKAEGACCASGRSSPALSSAYSQWDQSTSSDSD